MKKMVIAIIILVILLFATLFNVYYLDGFIAELSSTVELSRQAAEQDDFEEALHLLEKAILEWNHADGYTHVFIRHSEIDGTTDAFFELLSDLYERDYALTIGSYAKLLAHLSSIATMEHVSFGSIF